jgi:hypothetical protein
MRVDTKQRIIFFEILLLFYLLIIFLFLNYNLYGQCSCGPTVNEQCYSNVGLYVSCSFCEANGRRWFCYSRAAMLEHYCSEHKQYCPSTQQNSQNKNDNNTKTQEQKTIEESDRIKREYDELNQAKVNEEVLREDAA